MHSLRVAVLLLVAASGVSALTDCQANSEAARWVKDLYPGCTSGEVCEPSVDTSTTANALLDLLEPIAKLFASAQGCDRECRFGTKELPSDWLQYYCNRCQPEGYVPVEAPSPARRVLGVATPDPRERSRLQAQRQQRAVASLRRVNELVKTGLSKDDAWHVCKREMASQNV